MNEISHSFCTPQHHSVVLLPWLGQKVRCPCKRSECIATAGGPPLADEELVRWTRCLGMEPCGSCGPSRCSSSPTDCLDLFLFRPPNSGISAWTRRYQVFREFNGQSTIPHVLRLLIEIPKDVLTRRMPWKRLTQQMFIDKAFGDEARGRGNPNVC